MMNSPTILSLLTILLWSFGGVAAKLFNVEGGLALYLCLILAALFFYVLAEFYRSNKLYIPTISETFSKKSFIASLGFGFYWLLIYEGVAISNNASAPFAIQYIWVISNAVFFEYIFSEKKYRTFSVIPFLCSLLGFCGVLLLGFESPLTSQDYWLSLILPLGAGISFGYFSAYSSILKEEEHFRFLILGAFSGLLVLIAWSLIVGLSLTGITINQVIIAFALGFLIDGIGSYLWTKANRLVREQSSKIYSITIFPFLLPFLSTLLLYFIFGEENILNTNFILGLIIITLSSFLTKRFIAR
jgi:drug/metabolite transporter (DMT)-like permease